MWTDPEPNQVLPLFHGQGAIMQTHPNRPEPTDILEVERGMPGILAQEGIRIVRQPLKVLGQLVITTPEPGIGVVPQRSVQRPSRQSLKASAARVSRRPAATSSSICLSHASASYSANHERKAANSLGERDRTAPSISSIVVMKTAYRALRDHASLSRSCRVAVVAERDLATAEREER